MEERKIERVKKKEERTNAERRGKEGVVGRRGKSEGERTQVGRRRERRKEGAEVRKGGEIDCYKKKETVRRSTE